MVGPIARKILQSLVRARDTKVVALEAAREARDEMRRIFQHAIPSDEGGALHPGFAAYLYVTNWALGVVEAIQDLPELARHVERIAKAEHDHLPEGPPVSPVTRSMFCAWSMWDLTIGVKRENLGSILLAVGRAQGIDPLFLSILQTLAESSLGLHVHEGVVDGRIRLRELATQQLRQCVCPSGYGGEPGELWLARVLPPPIPALVESIVVATPYVIKGPGVAMWERYLDRALPRVKLDDRAAVYQRLMKRGPGDRYWFEYVFEAYANHQPGAVLLIGLPRACHAPSARAEPRASRAARRRGARRSATDPAPARSGGSARGTRARAGRPARRRRPTASSEHRGSWFDGSASR